jgi:hypothetical protein
MDGRTPTSMSELGDIEASSLGPSPAHALPLYSNGHPSSDSQLHTEEGRDNLAVEGCAHVVDGMASLHVTDLEEGAIATEEGYGQGGQGEAGTNGAGGQDEEKSPDDTPMSRHTDGSFHSWLDRSGDGELYARGVML